MMGISALPPELYHLVTEHLLDDIPTLLSVALSSRLLYQEAVQHIYREVHPFHITDRRAFLRTITSSQTLADLVRGWTIDLPIRDENEDFANLAVAGVRALRNLKYIRVQCASNRHGIQTHKVLSHASFQLDSIRWECTLKSHKAFLCSWMKTHPNLTNLHMAALWTSDASLNVDPTSLPPLTRVGGTHATLISLLPVCPTITEVYWTTAFGEGSVAHPRVLASLKQLRKLAFEWVRAQVKLWGVVDYLVNLEVMDIVQYHKEKNDPLLEEVIGKIPKLRWVLVHSHYNHTWDRTYDELASAIFRSNTSLRYISIEIPEQSNFTQYAYYHYYKRDSTAKSLVKFLGVAGAQRWFWGFNEKRYLEEGWEGF